MHFCGKCNNMFYMKLSDQDENTLIYYCRNCGNEDNTLTSQNLCVSKTKFKAATKDFSHYINAYTKDDPTLPRVTNIPCPNPACKTNTDGENREVIYIRYDDDQIKYIYLCSTCETAWQTQDQK